MNGEEKCGNFQLKQITVHRNAFSPPEGRLLFSKNRPEKNPKDSPICRNSSEMRPLGSHQAV
jgi:hypothetical protein